jgi:hypothetical protein
MSNRLAFAGAAFITIAALCRDLCAAEPRHYLLREPVQLVQRLDERHVWPRLRVNHGV